MPTLKSGAPATLQPTGIAGGMPLWQVWCGAQIV